jgi:hypothetical protein
MLRGIGTHGAYVSGLIIWGAGCSAVLGIEDLGSAPRLGADSGNGGDENGGSSGADASVGGTASGGRVSGTGGGGAATGGRTNGGAGGSLQDGSAGSSGGLGGAGGIGAGGAGGIGNGGAGGIGNGGAGGQNTGGGQGGSGGATGSPVNGKVIDFWGHPVPNVIVEIGTQMVNTGANGTFTVAGVGGTYDVALVPSLTSSTRGWIFQGLTRRDPTLQIDDGFDWRQADTYATTAGVTFPLTGQAIGYGFGSPHGSYSSFIYESPENLYWVYYYGPATTTGAGHALRWTVDPQNDFPLLYKAYDTVPLTMVEYPATVNFNLALGDDTNLGTGTISGSVTTGASARENHVYVRFQDGAAIHIVGDDAPAAGNYSYKVPVSLPNAGITVAAVAGDLGYSPIAIAHKDDAAAGQTGVDLTIPSPQALLAPVDAATANANTSFTWSGAAGVSVFSIIIDPSNTTVPTTMHVVTAAKTVRLPSFPAASYTIPPSKECFWWVESHGSIATVDAAAGPTGFLSAFTHHTLEGSRRGGGSYTESVHRSFTSPP